jgi:radical SAM superfamily enzyme with C-terminal helix-hairpin-helix motif
MMKFLSLLGALGAGVFAAAWLASLQRRGQGVRPVSRPLNINEASQQELMRVLGLDRETAERIVEHRPYPSKLDLLGRMVIPEEVYRAIKDRIAYKAG